MYVTRVVAMVLVFLLAIASPTAGFATTSPRYATAIDAVERFKTNQETSSIVEDYQGSFFETSLEGMLRRLNVTVALEDRVTVFPSPSLGLGSHIKIERAPVVTISDAGEIYQVRTWAKTVDELIEERRLELAAKDEVRASVGNTNLVDGAEVVVTRVAEVEITKTEPITFATVSRKTADLEKGQTQVATKGMNGIKNVTYLVKRVNGKEVSRKAVASVVSKPAVTEEILVGIGPKLTKVGPYKDTINAAAKKYLVNGTALHCLMMKESNGNPNSGANAQYKGLFQYTPTYWVTASAAAGFAGASIFNAEAQIFATARAIANGQSGRWPPWSRCSHL